jgi:hypothetical protein
MMKLKIYVAVIMVMSLLFAACKKESSPVDPGNGGNTQNYFPDNNNAFYKYDVVYQDTTDAVYEGERTTRYSGTVDISGTTYIRQIDSINLEGNITTGESFFRKSNMGVYYYLDTTGISEIFPAEYLSLITLSTEMTAFTSPLNENSVWTVFLMSILNNDLLRVEANVTGRENITINLLSGSVNREALKIKYLLRLYIPDPENLLMGTYETFETYAWIVDGIGVVRWEGSAAVVAAFTGGGIDIDETAAIVTQNLVEYRLTL